MVRTLRVWRRERMAAGPSLGQWCGNMESQGPVFVGWWRNCVLRLTSSVRRGWRHGRLARPYVWRLIGTLTLRVLHEANILGAAQPFRGGLHLPRLEHGARRRLGTSGQL